LTHNGIDFSVTSTEIPGVWGWQFQIGDRSFAGKTRTNLPMLAVRRVQQRIDRRLREIRRAEERANNPRSSRPGWEVGRRVARKDSAEKGFVVAVDDAVVKVKWDRGRTSYYRPDMPANVMLADSNEP